MKSSINSTGRQRITHSMVSFDILRAPSGEPKCFRADLSGLAALGLPEDAHVTVEPYFGHSGMRFDFGTIGAIAPPSDTNLDEIDRGGEINFRVKVIDSGSGRNGRLLAAGDRISASPPSDPGTGPKPLLPVKPESLGERIWDVSVSAGYRPHLLVNICIPGLAARIQEDPLLRGAILVEAFRKVLEAMWDLDAAECDWKKDWIIFVNDVLGLNYMENSGSDDDDNDERSTFVDEAVKTFASKFQFATNACPSDRSEELTYE